MEILYQNANFLVCIKPARVLSTDEPGGLPELVREALGDPKADVRTVHRLDRVVSGVMVLARNARAASELSRQIREDQFSKEYLAVVHGRPESPEGTLRDLLARDKARRMTFVADAPGKGVQEAALSYRVLEYADGMSLVRVRLHGCSFPAGECRWWGSGSTPFWTTPVKLPCGRRKSAFIIRKRGSGRSSPKSRPLRSRGRNLERLYHRFAALKRAEEEK